MKSKFYLERLGPEAYSVRLNKGTNTVGRAFDSTVKVSGKFASRNHCRIEIGDEHVSLDDFSFNGTYINEEQCKHSTKVLNENDKIGIGVYSVDDMLDDTELYVFKLHEIVNKTDKLNKDINIESDIIRLSDDSDRDSNEDNEEIVFKPLKSGKIHDFPNEPTSSAPDNFVHPAVVLKTSRNSTATHIADNDNNEVIKIKDEDKKVKDSPIKMETEISDFQSDELSQAVWDEIKQEIAELDLSEMNSNAEDLSDIKPNINDVDVYDLTLDDEALQIADDEEEVDSTTRQWFMKLSQNFDFSTDKKPIILDEIDSNKSDAKGEESGSKLKTEHKEYNLQSKQKIDKIKNKEEVSISDLVSNKKSNKIQIINAPSLPTKKGKLRGVSAVSPTTPIANLRLRKSPKKSSLVITPKKTIAIETPISPSTKDKYQGKWYGKPDLVKERNKIKQIKDKRKERLKEIAEKKIQNSSGKKNAQLKRKMSTSIEDIDEEEKSKLLKTAKVKVTSVNRGAFLTEIPQRTSTNNSHQNKGGNVRINHKDQKKDDPSSFASAISANDEKILDSSKQKMKTKIRISHKSEPENKKQRLDDIASNKKDVEIEKSEKQNKSSVSLKQSNEQKRISQIDTVNKSKISSNLKSCLKSIESIMNKDKTKKSVRFVKRPEVHRYEVEATEENITIIEKPNDINKKNMMHPDLSYYEGRRRMWCLKCSSKLQSIENNVLSEILSWKPEWLNRDDIDINDSKVLCPMIHSFHTVEDYQRIVFPLMKLELWERLKRDRKTTSNKFISLNLTRFEVEEKLKEKIIFICEYSWSDTLNRPLFFVSELVLLKFSEIQIFGHVRGNRCLNINSVSIKKNYRIEIEANFHASIFGDLKYVKTIDVQKISVIATELGAFEAVKNIEFSPLLEKILNPNKLFEKGNISKETLKKYKYNGYDKLNEIQEQILMDCYVRTLNPLKNNITLIEGPPGTGKSRLVTNLVLQLMYGLELRQLDRKILVCAQSNAAVDVITQKLIRIRQRMDSKKFRLVRYGVLDKMHPEVKPYSLTELIRLQKHSINMQNPNKKALFNEANLLEQKIKRLQDSKGADCQDNTVLEKARKDLIRIKHLLGENINEIDKNLEHKFLVNANIVCTTLSSCVRLLRYCNFFDVCIIDEATQCNEPWTLVPLQFGINSLILIGDTQQLPATTLSYLSKSFNYGQSYFTRAKELIEETKQGKIMSLSIQYRMHPDIAKWPNSYFYKNILTNDEITKSFDPVIKPYNVIELNFNQNKTTENGRIENCSEADFVVKLVQNLIEIMPIKFYSYGIITPYNLHRQNLREKLHKEKIEIEVNTIDSYQGKEKDVIIISNARTEGVGFLNEICRLNVALTRAKKCLILCGNFQQLTNINVWKSLLNDAKRRNLYFEPKENDLADFKNRILNRIKYEN